MEGPETTQKSCLVYLTKSCKGYLPKTSKQLNLLHNLSDV